VPTGPGYTQISEPEADGLSSLASYRKSLGGSKRRRCAAKKNFWLVNGVTGEICPLGCGRMTCGDCVGWLAARTAGAVGLSEPERFGRLSLVGDDWSTVRARMGRLRYDLRKALGKPFEWAWNVERNPKGTGHHVHFLTHGCYVPQRLLCRLADYNGMGHNTDIRQWRAQSSLAEAYGLKGLLYPMKSAQGVELPDFLELNGKRLIHASRGFFRFEGQRLALEDARRQWSTLRGGTAEPDPWGVVYQPAWEEVKK
jgi:hypothetical protein